MRAVYVLGVAMTQFGVSRASLQDLITSAAETALAEAGEVDAIILGTMTPEEYLHEANLATQIADRLGLSGVPAIRIETASSSGAAAFHMAVQMIAAGGCRRVLAVAGEKMSHVSATVSAELLSHVLEYGDRQLGLGMPAMAALVTNMYAQEHGIPGRRMCRGLAAVAMKNHDNAVANPYAQFRRAITLEEYLSARIIAPPLRLFDCAPISDGAAAVVLGTERSEIRVAGIGQATDRLALCQRETLSHFPATRWAAARAYAAASFGPDAVTFAEVHDAFTSFELVSAEDLGLLRPGTAVAATLRGHTGVRGRIPVNPSGGLKARGHPVGASGLAQIVELTWQMRESVTSDRRVRSADIGLAHSIGGPGANNFVTLLQRSTHVRVPRLAFEYEAFFPRPPAPGRAKPPRVGRARVLAHTVLLARSPRAAPVRIALLECTNGARLFARFPRNDNPIEAGDQVRFTATADRYRAAAVDRFRAARVRVRRLLRRLSPTGQAAVGA